MLRRTRALNGPTSTSHLVVRNKHYGQLGHNEIALYVNDFEEPLITTVTDEIILGRVSRVASITEQPSVDLTSYQAVERGVSRAHAALRRYPTGDLALVDMESTNGTWLNSSRLAPNLPTVISNGARVVLAKMTLYVYF